MWMSHTNKDYIRINGEFNQVLNKQNIIRFVIDPLFPAKKTGNDDFNNKNEFELLLQG